MTHRVNVMLDDDVWQQMQKLPRGERSRLLNRAVRSYLRQQQREQAARAMDEVRESSEPLPGSAEQWIREDRNSHWKD